VTSSKTGFRMTDADGTAAKPFCKVKSGLRSDPDDWRR